MQRKRVVVPCLAAKLVSLLCKTRWSLCHVRISHCIFYAGQSVSFSTRVLLSETVVTVPTATGMFQAARPMTTPMETPMKIPPATSIPPPPRCEGCEEDFSHGELVDCSKCNAQYCQGCESCLSSNVKVSCIFFAEN